MMAYRDRNKLNLHSFNGPVTALQVLSQKLLVGCGNEVSIYNVSSLHLESRKQVLHGACVHGFSKGPFDDTKGQFISVHGAKQACIVTLKPNDGPSKELTAVSDIAHFPDWIWETQWVKHKDIYGTIAVAMAHNTVVLWDYVNNQILHHQDCVEKCILYCSHLIGNTWKDLVMIGGTVYNQMVLWLVSHDHKSETTSSADSNKSPAPVLHIFSGHKGVIFSIQYHTEHQRLCSVSDDRSIRMWQIEFENGKTASPTVNDWKSMKSSLLLSVFGHSARVWDVVLMTDYFASTGEDATSCIWDYSGHVISKFKGHRGKSIWSITSTEDEQHILTGGGDGSVRMWEVNTKHAESSSHKSLDVSSLSSVADGDFPRIVTLLDFDILLIMMNSGTLYSYSMRDQRFDCVLKDSRFTSYSIISLCPDKQTVAVGSIGGLIIIFQLIPDNKQQGFGTMDNMPQVEESLFDSKVLGLVWMSTDKLVASGPQGLCHVIHVAKNESMDISTIHIVRESSLFLPVSKHRWISAACLIDIPGVMSTKLIICGDKDGTIYSYKVSQETDSVASSDIFQQPSQSFTKVHGKNGVTYLCFNNGLLYSLGRDGYCRHWGVKNAELVQLHGSKVVKGLEWIDRLEWNNGDMLFYGFLSTEFIIWSQLYNQKLFCVECGGGHRSWCCSYDHGAFRFAYLKGGMVHTVDSAQCSKHQILKPALHGKELHEVKLLGISEDHEVIPFFLTCTASEDTTVNIGLYCNIDGFTLWKPLAALRGHLSSVRSLALSSQILKVCKQFPVSGSHVKGSENLLCERSLTQNSIDFILFTGGGRAEIRVWKVNIKNHDELKNFEDSKRTDGDMDNCDTKKGQNSSLHGDHISCTHQEWSTHYLGESRHKRPYSKWKTRKLRLDPETRVMSLDASFVCEVLRNSHVAQACNEGEKNNVALDHLHIVSAAGSDGLLRIFCYNDHTRKLSSIAQSAFHEGCVLKVHHFLFKSKSDCFFLAFSTSTNGKIAVWSMDPIVKRAVEMENKMAEILQLQRPKHQISNKIRCHHDDSDTKFDDDSDELIDDDEMEIAEENETTNTNKKENEKMENFMPVCSFPAHQSGINSIHTLQLTDTTLLLASGGDDNALTVQVIEVKGQEIKVISHMTNTTAHSAQITGVKLVSDNLLISGSIDQRICVWRLDINGANIKMDMLSCCYIYLADVSCMDVCLHKNAVYLCLGGEGLCLYSWNIDKK